MSYRTSPASLTTMPPGIPYIIGNEFAERFSFYGMRALLYTFMTTALTTHGGAPDLMSPAKANEWTHTFIAAVYFTPFLGALLSDLWLGKYRTIIWLSLVYCLGHLVLAFDNTRTGLVVGLSLIAIGAGGIKPCVSAHVGDQFARTNAHLLTRAFNWFYLSINIGAAISQLLTPKLLEWYGPHVAFGVPGILMLLATFAFWMGRNTFAHVQSDRKQFIKDLCSPTFLRALAGLIPLFILIAGFWSIFDQSATAWVEQAKKMDLKLLGWELNPAQMQFVNPVCILLLVPLFTLIIYPRLGKLVKLTPLRRIGAGFIFTLAAIYVAGWIEQQISNGLTPSIGWQILAYFLITGAEILISITALEFSYTQAPPQLKSLVMSLDLWSVALGNIFTARVNAYIEKVGAAANLSGANYWWFFMKVTAVTTVLFMIVSLFYKGRIYLQDEAEATSSAS
jgi:proton-dependent oligopeptide transporter, POT family